MPKRLGPVSVLRPAAPCEIGGAEAVTLDFVARDYLGHLRHHLAQLGLAEGVIQA